MVGLDCKENIVVKMLNQQLKANTKHNSISIKGTLVKTESSKIPLPPNPEEGEPFNEEITDTSIGSTSCATASSGLE